MIAVDFMKHEDLIDVIPIEKLCFGDRWNLKSFANELDNPASHYFVAREGDRIVGYAGYWLILEESHITTVGVHPTFQRRYIGERLLLHLIDDAAARGAKWVTLEVRASNVGAQRLYEKYGFTSLGRRKGYYQEDGEDALVMWTENIWQSAYRERLEQLRGVMSTRTASVGVQ